MFGFKSSKNELEKRRKLFLENRFQLVESDESFVKSVFTEGTEIEKSISIILRRLIAQNCGVDSVKLKSSDNTADIEPLMVNGKFLLVLAGSPEAYDGGTFFLLLSRELRKCFDRDINLKWKPFIKSLYPFGTNDGRSYEEAMLLGDWIRSETNALISIIGE